MDLVVEHWQWSSSKQVVFGTFLLRTCPYIGFHFQFCLVFFFTIVSRCEKIVGFFIHFFQHAILATIKTHFVKVLRILNLTFLFSIFLESITSVEVESFEESSKDKLKMMTYVYIHYLPQQRRTLIHGLCKQVCLQVSGV